MTNLCKTCLIMERESIKHRKKLKLLAKKVDVQMIGDVRTFTSDNSFMIGEGCYGTSVFLGMEANGNAVAVKRILTSTTARSKSVDKEVKLLKLLKSKRSEHIVHYREFKPGNPFSFLILDLCEETLADFVELNNKKYLETKGTVVIKEILTGLLELHSQRILHMDLKPQNILVNIDGHMLLSDFGISRKLKDDETTVRTDAKGTRGWMAVESLREPPSKARFKKKSDIQVAGMVSFYVLTKGGHPFGDRNHRTSNIIDGDPVDLMKLTNETARRFVKWLIAHDPKDRPYAGEALQDVFLQSNIDSPDAPLDAMFQERRKAFKTQTNHIFESPECKRAHLKVFDMDAEFCRVLFNRLNTGNNIGIGYTTLAGLMDYTAEMVSEFRSTENPAENLVRYWSQKNSNNVLEFARLLKKMHREDLLDLLKKKLPECDCSECLMV